MHELVMKTMSTIFDTGHFTFLCDSKSGVLMTLEFYPFHQASLSGSVCSLYNEY